MSITHLGRAVQFICGNRHTTATQIAANAGLSHVVVSRASNGTRLEVKNLKALCTAQPDPRDNMDLLIAHLRDEIERAGHSTHSIEITADASRIDDDLRTLMEAAREDEQLRGMLRELASFVRTHPLQADAFDVAAEPAQASYGVKPDTAGHTMRARAAAKASPPTAPTPPRSESP